MTDQTPPDDPTDALDAHDVTDTETRADTPDPSVQLDSRTTHELLKRRESRILLTHLAERYRSRDDGDTLRIGRHDLIATLREELSDPTTPFGDETATTEIDRAVTVVYHMAVPRLADAGVVAYDTDRNEVVVTPSHYMTIHQLLAVESLVSAMCESTQDAD